MAEENFEGEYITCFMCGTKVKRNSDIWYPIPLSSGKMGYLCEPCSIRTSKPPEYKLQGDQDIPCLKPVFWVGDTGVGPHNYYNKEESVREFTKLLDNGFTVINYIEYILIQMKKRDQSSDYLRAEKYISWIEYFVWLYNEATKREGLSAGKLAGSTDIAAGAGETGIQGTGENE